MLHIFRPRSASLPPRDASLMMKASSSTTPPPRSMSFAAAVAALPVASRSPIRRIRGCSAPEASSREACRNSEGPLALDVARRARSLTRNRIFYKGWMSTWDRKSSGVWHLRLDERRPCGGDVRDGEFGRWIGEGDPAGMAQDGAAGSCKPGPPRPTSNEKLSSRVVVVGERLRQMARENARTGRTAGFGVASDRPVRYILGSASRSWPQ
jgi:hypothetical protein